MGATEEVRVEVDVRNPVEEVRVVVELKLEAATLQVPNAGWHPAAQYALVLPHLDVQVSLYSTHKENASYQPYWEQQLPYSSFGQRCIESLSEVLTGTNTGISCFTSTCSVPRLSSESHSRGKEKKDQRQRAHLDQRSQVSGNNLNDEIREN